MSSSAKKSNRKARKASLGTLYHGALSARVYLRLRMAQHLKATQQVADTKPAAEKTRSSTLNRHDHEIQCLLKDAKRLAEEAVEIERDRLERHKSKVEADELLSFLQEHADSLDVEECEVL